MDPSLNRFNFTGICSRYIDSNGYSLRIGEQTAEQLKIRVGCAYPLDQEQTSEVRGVDVVSGVPRRAIVTSEDLVVEIPRYTINHAREHH